MHGEKDVGLFVGIVGVAGTLWEGVVGGVDGECVALELVAAVAIEVARVGAADGAGGRAGCYVAIPQQEKLDSFYVRDTKLRRRRYGYRYLRELQGRSLVNH